MPVDKHVLKQLDEVDWDFAGYNPNSRGAGIHNIHWYPAPFPAALAGTLIDILGSNASSFLDPFSGSSVAPLEAWFRGKRAVGIDNNRFAIEIAKAKVQLVRDGRIEIAHRLVADYLAFRKSEILSWSKMGVETICRRAAIDDRAAKWFIQPVLFEIAIIKLWMKRGSGLVRKWQGPIATTLSSLLHGRLSIARNYHYTYVVDNSRVKEEAVDRVDVSDTFASKLLDNMIQGQIAREQLVRISYPLTEVPEPEFVNAHSQDVYNVAEGHTDLVVTSPPYFGMNDYVRSQYLSWLVFQWPEYERDIKTESGSRRHRNGIGYYDTYFADMRDTFTGIYRILPVGGYLAVILGSSSTKLARDRDPIAELAIQLDDIGFHRIWSGKRRVRFRKINNTPYRDEVIWVLQR